MKSFSPCGFEVPINEPELCHIELFRVALSEQTHELRVKAIANVKHDIIAERLDLLSSVAGKYWAEEPENQTLAQKIAATSAVRHLAGRDFAETGRRYEEQGERKLNIAEYIGTLVWRSIQAGKREGVQTKDGILQRVSADARQAKVRGAKDKDVLRAIWNSYRGVAHLGMAIGYCEDNPEQQIHVLHLAEQFRSDLSKNAPRGTEAPYVEASSQISFLYLSTLSGPRFRNRGLPFGME
jgi:hypothetical protein